MRKLCFLAVFLIMVLFLVPIAYCSSVTYDYVDARGSNVDGKADVGSNVDFTRQQAVDGNNDTLTTAGQNSTETFGQFGGTSGTSSYTAVMADGLLGSVYTSNCSDGEQVDSITFYARSSATTKFAKAVLVFHSNLTIVPNGVGSAVGCTTTAGLKTSTYSSKPTIYNNTEYVLAIVAGAGTNTIRLYYDTGSTNQSHYDTSNNYETPTDPTDATHGDNAYYIYANFSLGGSYTDYAIDFEEQWGDIDYDADVLELCLLTGDFNTSNKMAVDLWNYTSSSWMVLTTSLNESTWNNITITGKLTNASAIIHLYNESVSQNSAWGFDAILIAETILGEWHQIAQLNFDLIVRQWNQIGQVYFDLLTRQWTQISQVYFDLIRGWNQIGQLFFDIRVPAWHQIGQFILSLNVYDVWFIIRILLFVAFLSLIGLYFLRKKGDST